MRLAKPRVNPVSDGELTDEQKAILEPLGRGGKVLNIFRTMINHPTLFKKWLGFANYVLGRKSTLDPRERELAILRIGWLCRSEYEWGQHVIIGKQTGLTDADIERISQGPDVPGWDAFDAMICRAVDELHSDKMISDATWKALSERYSHQQLLDLVFAVGQYNLVSMALNTFGVQLDAGIPGFKK